MWRTETGPPSLPVSSVDSRSGMTLRSRICAQVTRSGSILAFLYFPVVATCCRRSKSAAVLIRSRHSSLSEVLTFRAAIIV